MESRGEKGDMVLFSGYDARIKEPYNVYLELYPYKVYDIDFAIILDTAYDIMKSRWATSIRRTVTTKYADDLLAFMHGENLWITDINGEEHLLNKEVMLKGLEIVIFELRYNIIGEDNRLLSECIGDEKCDDIIQLSLFDAIRFV
jgi:hypothetical protein